MFPGQGSQVVGMGKAAYDAFPAAREVFEEVDEALHQKLTSIIFDGPQEALTMTENTQPALMATSIALLRVLEKEGGLQLEQFATYVIGHSLGEYTALCAAGSLDVATTARLLRIRGTAMQQAVPAGKGAMAALLGVDEATTTLLVTQASIGDDACQVANDNGGGQIVISGTQAAIERAIAMAPQLGVKKAIKLPVSAPFHSRLMEPAKQRMKEALADVTLRAPIVPIIANVTARPENDPSTIASLLVAQVTGTVRFRESVEFFAEQATRQAVEIGAGKVLAGLVKRIAPDIQTVSLQTPEDIEAFLKIHA